jgi:hypothetical protein
MITLTVETWHDKVERAAQAVEVGDEDQAAALITDALVKLLKADRAGNLATPNRIRRIIAAYQHSGRRIRDLM